jgi:molecular chaperone DnaK
MTISGGSSLAQDDIQRMMAEAQEHAEEDRQRKEEAETRNMGESLVYQTEKLLAESGDKIPEDLKGRINDATGSLKGALGGSDIEAIKTATEELSKVSQEAGQAMYAAAQAEQGTQPSGSASAQGGADDVVDAEIVDDDKDQK